MRRNSIFKLKCQYANMGFHGEGRKGEVTTTVTEPIGQRFRNIITQGSFKEHCSNPQEGLIISRSLEQCSGIPLVIKNLKVKMWKLKIGAETVGEGGYQWLKSVNNHLGRQVWEFNPELGSPEELQRIEDARKAFWNNRFERQHSSDLLMRIQFEKENPCVTNLPQLKVKDEEEVTEEVVKTTLRRAISFYSTIQAHDGHWPGDYGVQCFCFLVITLSITGALNAVLSKEHQHEMCRYLYNHQARMNKDGGWGLHIEGPSTMFGTALNYVTLRLLGEGADDGQGQWN
ncbi:hypothetical protein Prudu_008164 [Prunus dulcis]|uniref:Squalene cyclase N-terminal domain-containing protein n=1 Tax=Prunus dulcis TaxID=3755 RepID=A0A4Y1R3H2_PRUDU|nr:hypothetical protein Prudu_008164 [Prunus dulcis]